MRHPPGATRDDSAHRELVAAFESLESHSPRTRHWDSGRPRYVNRLIREISPYLSQHAHNPVDWRPWGEGAFSEARDRDIPIFLSAGYATCHWCHVMEEESFDSEDIAEILNRAFLPVKLDREQSPDIDQIYITATSLQRGHAGWPNSVWMLHDGKPFHTGTYFPKEAFAQTLAAIERSWAGPEKRKLVDFAGKFHATVKSALSRETPSASLSAAPSLATGQLARSFNPERGGFSAGQQFPHEGYVLHLLDCWQRDGGGKARDMALKTLDEIVAGGLHDHAGGGFHRYTVDVNWRTPHFEKMLYNQALLIEALSEAWWQTGAPRYQRAVERAVGYLERDMTSGGGAFFTAEDADSADSHGNLEEGAFYVWTKEQALEADPSADIAALGLMEAPTMELGGVIHLDPGGDLDFGRLDETLERLRRWRDSRPRPLRDDKIICGWNGLAIRAVARAARIFDRPEWMELAKKAAGDVIGLLLGESGLKRIARKGVAVERANLSDYVWLAHACVEISKSSPDGAWKDTAKRLAGDAMERFQAPAGRLASTAESPVGPVMEMEDGAVPAGESRAIALFAELGMMSPGSEWKSAAARLAGAVSGSIAEMPVARLEALRACRLALEGQTGPCWTMFGGLLEATLLRAPWRLRLEIKGGYYIERGMVSCKGMAAEFPDRMETSSTIRLDSIEESFEAAFQLCGDGVCMPQERIWGRVIP